MAIAEETRATEGGSVQPAETALFFALLTGIVVGGIYFMKGGGKAAAADELRMIFDGILNSYDGRQIFLYTLCENAVLCAVIFAGAFFRPGFIFPFPILLRGGFVWGVTAAAAIYGFGMPGVLLLCPFAFETMTEMTGMILFSAYAVRCSIAREIKSKKKLIFLIIFAISIFCIAALLKGFLTTRFIILLYPKFA